MTKKTSKKPIAKSSPKPKTLKVERVFDASPKTLWSYWTEPEKFAKWFNPAPGIDLVVHEYDVRRGGRVRFDMPQPDGNRNPQEGVFHVIEPPRRLVSGAPDKSFLIEVEFTPVGKRTRVTVTVTGIPTELHLGAVKGWNAGFNKLAALLGAGASSAASPGFTLERTFKVPPGRLWALWTTKEGLESWWGPEGFTMKVHALDLRPGGAFEYEMTATDPEQVAALNAMNVPLTSVARNAFTEVAPERRLAMKTRIDFIPNVAPYDVTTVVEFQAVRGGTKAVLTSGKMHNSQWQDLARQGWTSQLDKLAKVIEGVRMRPNAGDPMTVTLVSDTEILITRVLAFPRDRVFAAYTDPKAIPRWWGPRGYTTRVATMDVRPGGRWRFVQHDLEGKEHGFHGMYREVVPPTRLAESFEYEGTPGHVVEETMTFEALGQAKTRIRVQVRFANKEDRDAMIDAHMELGMRESYERLEALLRADR